MEFSPIVQQRRLVCDVASTVVSCSLEDRFKACPFETEQVALSDRQAEEDLRKEFDRENERSLAIVQRELFGEEEV